MARTKSTAAEKTAPAKKTASKKTAAAKETAAVKEAPAKADAPAKKASEKVVTKIQFGECEYDVAEIVEKAKADYKASNKGAVKSLNVYIKPEDSAAYYVVNDNVTGKVDL